MNNQPLVSIVVPAYNVEKYLRQCVDSILNQTYKNWELLLVVGGQDKTPTICDEYAAKDKRIKSIHDNKGLAPARNVGFQHATGEWVTYIDGDDWVEPDMLEVAISKVNETANLDIVFWTYVTDLNGVPMSGKWTYKEFEDNKVYEGEECKQLAVHTLKYSSGIATCYCKLIRVKYAKKYGLIHDSRVTQGEEGVEFILRCFYNAQRVQFVKRSFYHYIVNPNSISKKVNYQNTQKIADCFEVMREDIAGFTSSEKYMPLYYERAVYGIIAVAMNTYFSPDNKDCYFERKRHFIVEVAQNAIFAEAIKKVSTENMDKLRKITFFFLKNKMYLLLQIVAWTKHTMMKLNFYNY